MQGLGSNLVPGLGLGYDDMEPDSGAVFTKGLKKLAVYCDADGKKHVRSALCTHLDCVVSWNSIEKTFDCCCHGR